MPFVRSVRGHSMSMRYQSKSKTGPSKVLPLRWSFASKDRRKPSSVAPQTGNDELVEYLESGRRPRCTKEPIVSIVASPSQVKAQPREDDSLSSPSCSSSVERCSYQGPDSPRLPEGQSRPAADLSGITSDGSLTKNSSKTRQEHKRTQVSKSLQGSPSALSNGTSNTASHSRDSYETNRLRNQPAATSRTHPSQTQTSTGESRSKDGAVISTTQLQDKEVGHRKTLSSKSLTKLSLSNGTLNGKGIEARKTGTAHKSTSNVVNSREKQVCSSTADIKRTHSSSNIQSRLDMTLKRTLSLQRNGPLVPASHKGPVVDKSSYATLQKIRYSSTSLGRQRPVPESCFWWLSSSLWEIVFVYVLCIWQHLNITYCFSFPKPSEHWKAFYARFQYKAWLKRIKTPCFYQRQQVDLNEIADWERMLRNKFSEQIQDDKWKKRKCSL